MADLKYLTIDHIDTKTLARIFSKIVVNRDTGCWLWTAAQNKSGYSKLSFEGSRSISAHRVLYAWLVEPLPKGVGRHIPCLDHFVCDTPRCVNPSHLRLVSPRDNLLRGGGAPAQNARKTHCQRGHLLPKDANLRSGSRYCKTCNADNGRANYLKHREAYITRTGLSQKARMNGPRREELLAEKRRRYHETKQLAHRDKPR